VSVLERADDEELQCYLLQLVQALRFERSDKSRLSQFLVQRGMCEGLSTSSDADSGYICCLKETFKF
jgi:hypothetical protein